MASSGMLLQMNPMMIVFHKTVVGRGIASNSWRARWGWPSRHSWLRRYRIVRGFVVKDILVQQGLLKPLLGNKPESMDQDDWEELQAKDKSSIECWYCKEIGHIARRCPERKEKKNGKKHVNNANVIEEDDKSSDGDLYLVSSVEQQEDPPPTKKIIFGFDNLVNSVARSSKAANKF
ncbi:hypothetical protein RJ640_009872 [Escallonia rubra]|uniref:CCHC-type domain-containing protein n=1 Tax=Escallonia rubra TaxID=112253 RepID=A0AA88RYD7_9ASTE|nr:hypothetical protein RJ640_009872 [Escallonia rubra]